MQRFLPSLPLLTVVVVVHSPLALGQGPSASAVSPVRAPVEMHRGEQKPPDGRPSARAANEQLVRELTCILKKTKSQDTFLVTVKALADIGPRAKPAVPAIILHAERLGLLKDFLQQADDDDNLGPAVMVSEAIADIVMPKRDRQSPPPYAAPVPYCTPPMVPPPPPAKRDGG
jgi:hypothetical protein